LFPLSLGCTISVCSVKLLSFFLVTDAGTSVSFYNVILKKLTIALYNFTLFP